MFVRKNEGKGKDPSVAETIVHRVPLKVATLDNAKGRLVAPCYLGPRGRKHNTRRIDVRELGSEQPIGKRYQTTYLDSDPNGELPFIVGLQLRIILLTIYNLIHYLVQRAPWPVVNL